MGGLNRVLACILVLTLLFSCFPVHSLATEVSEIAPETTLDATPAEETVPETTMSEETEPVVTIPVETIPEPEPEATDPEETIPETTVPEETVPMETEPEQTGLGLYFGQLHAHSDISDGTEAPEALYRQARAEGLDFFALTDHGDSITPEDWAAGQSAAEAASDGKFIGLFGYEMSWPQNMQIGHIGAFCTDQFVSWEQEEFRKFDGALETYYDLLGQQPGAIGQFNHPGTQYGTFADFSHISEEADPVMALLEIDFSAQNPIRYYSKALDAGWHVAPSGGSRTVLWAEELTEKALYDALRSRRVYTAEDTDLEILYACCGYPAGSRLELRHIGASPSLSVSLSDPTDDAVGTVEVITVGGAVFASGTLAEAAGNLSFSIPAEAGYYYLRITQPDGDQAVTAPIWIDDSEDLGITGLTCDTAVPVQNESVCLTLQFSNRETGDFLGETLEILADGTPIQTLTEPVRFPANARTEHRISLACDCVGLTEITVRLSGTLEGHPRCYEASIPLNFHQSAQVTGILVDSGHGNAGLDSLGILKDLAKRENIQVTFSGDISPELLKGHRFLLVSAPSQPFSEDFLEAVTEFAGYGGSIVLCGQADMLENDFHSAGEMNRLLAAVGSTLTIHTNTARDPVTNRGEPWQLYLSRIQKDNPWCAGVTANQVYRLAPGCTVDPGDGSPLVWGRDTTEPENGVVLAWEALSGGGTVFTAGNLFLSDENLAAPKNLWDPAYANRTVARNLLGIGGDAVTVSTIAQARSAEENRLVRIRGHVTAGTSSRYNTFPDAIYLQDDTGGIAVVPFSRSGIQVGTPMEVMGHVQTLGGNRVLKLTDWKIPEDERYHHPPKTGDWVDLLNPAKNGGTLIEVEGECLEIYCREDDTLAGCLLEDEDGNTARIQIEDYIFAGSDGENDLHEEICKGRTIRAMGILHVNEYGEAVIRARNCEEVYYVPPRRYYNPRTGDVALPTAVSAMILSLTGLVLLRKRKTV